MITSTTTPTPVEELIASVDTLARNVPLEALSRVVTELGTAFNGQGDNLQTLVDSLVLFTETGIQLASGEHLDADVIVSATGLNLLAGATLLLALPLDKLDHLAREQELRAIGQQGGQP